MSGLSVSNLISVQIILNPQSAQVRSFGTLLVAGDSTVISPTERLRAYSSFDQVEADFGVDAPETKAAELYYEQAPQPSAMYVGRWVRTASAGFNEGAILTPSQQSLANWTTVALGSFTISVNGTPQTITGLDFTAQTNLNGVATVITGALSGATCTWDGFEFKIASSVTGAGTKASGTVTASLNPANSHSLTLNGVAITFVSGTPSGNQVKIGASKEATMANLQVFLQSSINSSLAQATYATSVDILTITYKTVGVAGNSYSIAQSDSDFSISGMDLAGGVVASSVGYATAAGSGTDISAQLGLTALTSQQLVPGYAPETPEEAVAIFCDMSAAWYGLQFAASVQPTDDQNVDVANLIEAQPLTRVFGVTIQTTGVLSSVVSSDLSSRLKALGLNQSLTQYSSSNAYAIASFFGRAFTVDYSAANSVIDLMYKQEPGVVAENLTDAQAAVLKAKNCNVFVNYVNDTQMIQWGVVASGNYFDVINGTDWIQNAIQTAAFNALYTTSTKVPQTDAGVNQVTGAIAQVCSQAVSNGLAAPGVWTGPSFGALKTGDFLKNGFYIYAQPVALQSQADRDARKCPPITVALKLSGAIQTASVVVDVNS